MPEFDGLNNFGPHDPSVITAGISWGGKNDFKFSVDIGYVHNVGDFNAGYGLGLTYYSDFYDTGKKGLEIRHSASVGYEKDGNYARLGTNWFRGVGELDEFDQRTGIVSLKHGDVSFAYENDGSPFQYIGLADKHNDSYRTAAISLGIGDFFIKTHLFTGLRDSASFKAEEEDEGVPVPGETNKERKARERGTHEGRGRKGDYGERYKHGRVRERGPRYRYGGLTANYKGLSVGVNSDWVRHAVQNIFAHRWMQPQKQFDMLSGTWEPIYSVSTQFGNYWTLWQH